MSLDLLLRYLIITIAAHLACAWMRTFQSPWPLVDAFELADCTEEQLFRSLGVSLSNFKASLKPLLRLALAVGCRVALLKRGFSLQHGGGAADGFPVMTVWRLASRSLNSL